MKRILYCLTIAALTVPMLQATGAEEAAAKPGIYDVHDYGAVGDGETLDTKAIQAAIDKSVDDGGGRVVLSGGTFLSGTIFLKSGTTLVLEDDAILLASTDIANYPAMEPAYRSYTENYSDKSLIYAEKQENISILGGGKIDGQGNAKSFRKANWKGRPFLLRFVECKNVTVKGITLVDSPFWTQHYLACDDVLIDGITVDSRRHWVADGLDIDSCHRVRVVNCDIRSMDDAIALKTTSPRACKDVTVENCKLSSTGNAFKFGTESTGNFENIVLTNCTLYDTKLAGVALMTVDGGVIDNVRISDITMRDVKCPIFLRLGNRARHYMSRRRGSTREVRELPEGVSLDERPGVGALRNVIISDIKATGAGFEAGRLGKDGACPIAGMEGHLIENIILKNISIQYRGYETALKTQPKVPERDRRYPEQNMFGVLPAYGFYVRHAKNVRLESIDLSFDRVEARPAIALDDVEDFYLKDATVDVEGKDLAPVWFERVTSARIHSLTRRTAETAPQPRE